jgi:hypothetical protein
MEKMKPGRARTKMYENETMQEYDRRMKKHNYHTNAEYAASKKLQYYKKLYKENEDFQIILETNNNIIETLLEVVTFHQKKKLNLI